MPRNVKPDKDELLKAKQVEYIMESFKEQGISEKEAYEKARVIVNAKYEEAVWL